MTFISSQKIRESFLSFFESKNHQRIRSSSLIPDRDPTLFFTNAGMVQFKNIFLGLEKPSSVRATTSQKCMRVSGKHNDLENVGRTHRHHTFFEMLGNFSFGDYFKKDAIRFAWEFLTQTIQLDPSRLWVTVFREDDEAAELWKTEVGLPLNRIVRLDERDNFWSMGEEGPCGPCSEIYFDHGPTHGCGQPDCKVGCDCERYMEIWNLVFMQFNRKITGELEKLPKPSVDTGMGLERLSCVVQGVHSNYDSDLFTPIIREIEKKINVTYGKDEKTNISIRVLADHIRAAVFLIGEGIQPSNEGRGYVLRRILRRAIRHGRLLGLKQPFFYQLADVVIQQMTSAYPELTKHQSFISSSIEAEESRFLETLEKGLAMIDAEIQRQQGSENKCFAGELIFKLYDTFGFPVDLIQNIAEEEGFLVDLEGFESAMDDQRATARKSWKGSGAERVSAVYQELAQALKPVEFLGYQTLETDSEVIALIRNGEVAQEVKAGEEVQIITQKTPFYGESGGQVGDQGLMTNAQGFKMEVSDTQKPNPHLTVHVGRIKSGSLKVGANLHLEVDLHHRAPTRLNHTATHLLHAALREILGDHVRQAGSLVAPHRLRFDFSHFEPVNVDNLELIESRVNQKIRENLLVEKLEMSYDQALETGAMALFGEKYGDQVRVLKAGDFSIELCGGTHVDRTGDIGFFKIIQETSVAAGIRRIEALTGEDALAYCRKLERQWYQLAHQLKASVEEVPQKVQRSAEQLKKAEREIAQLKKKLLEGASATDWTAQIQQIQNISVVGVVSEAEDIASLREFSDQVINRLKTGVAAIGAVIQGKVTLIIKVSKDLTHRYKANEIIKPLAEKIGGSGGGKAEMAQAGGIRIEGLEEAVKQIYTEVNSKA